MALRVLFRKLGFSLVEDRVNRFRETVGGRSKRAGVGRGSRRVTGRVSREDRELRKLRWVVNYDASKSMKIGGRSRVNI